MEAREARDLGRRLAHLINQGETTAAYAVLLTVLQTRTAFRLLDMIGEETGRGPMEAAGAFARSVARGKAEGGWVVVASILREQLAGDISGALEQARAFVAEADIWYAADIFGERVPGPALLLDFEQALHLLAPWTSDPDRWVRRTVGVAVHFWAKRSRGDPARGRQAEKLLSLLEPMFEERNVDAAKGVAWGLKTLGRYYPELTRDWLLRQADSGRRPSALMLRKAVTSLAADRRGQILKGFAR